MQLELVKYKQDTPSQQEKDGEKIREAEKKQDGFKIQWNDPLFTYRQGEFILQAMRNLITIPLNLISIYHLNFSTGTQIYFFRLGLSNLLNSRNATVYMLGHYLQLCQI